MQFVINHTTFDSGNELDQALLDAYKPLGVEPGKTYDAAKVTPIDGATFRQVSEEVKQANVAVISARLRNISFARLSRRATWTSALWCSRT
jgi:hypothetical protein